jgi:hypothetical protein
MSADYEKSEKRGGTASIFMFVLPILSPLFLAWINYAFPKPKPGPWPYGQPELLVENLCLIAFLLHLVFTLASVVMSLWLIQEFILRMVYWLGNLLLLILVVTIAAELSMNKAGKWL